MTPLEHIINQKFPLCKIFRDISAECDVFYDGKANFAFLLGKQEEDLLYRYLSSDFDIKESLSPAENKIIANFDTLRKAGLFLPGPLEQVSTTDTQDLSELIDYYDNNVLQRKYVLEATEDCNYRCTYCFNTLHEGSGLRQHSKKNMTLDTAKKSIDHYFSQYVKIYHKLNEEKREKLLEKVPPTLSWYGGETTLNWDTVVEATEYFKSLPWRENGIDPKYLFFSFNTNMSVMTEDMIRFCIENDYLIYASIDGPKEENDKCRVLPGGEGTFDIIMNNLRKIKEADPEYFSRRINILGVEAEIHDVDKCREFFEKWEFPELDVSVNTQELEGCFYRDPQKELDEMISKFEKNLEIYKEIIDKATLEDPGSDLKGLIKYTNINFDNPSGSNRLNVLLTCPMGIDNNMVGVDGNVHICHKTDGSYPFANISSTPLDYSKLVELYRRHNESVNKHCSNCWAIHFCNVCGARRLQKGEFKNPTQEECDVMRADTSLCLSAVLYMAVSRPDLFKNLHDRQKKCDDYISVIDINEFDNI